MISIRFKAQEQFHRSHLIDITMTSAPFRYKISTVTKKLEKRSLIQGFLIVLPPLFYIHD